MLGEEEAGIDTLSADELADDLRYWIRARGKKIEHRRCLRAQRAPLLRCCGLSVFSGFAARSSRSRQHSRQYPILDFTDQRTCALKKTEFRSAQYMVRAVAGNPHLSKRDCCRSFNRIYARFTSSRRTPTRKYGCSKRLRSKFNEIPNDIELAEIFRGLSLGQWNSAGKKILIVLDQFEQRLSRADDYDQSQLAKALRHCDGERIQCLMLIRDDFYLSLTRFFDALEMDVGRNSQAIDLFDRDHAKKVLIKLGRAYNRLPEEPAELSDVQNAFRR